MAPTIKSIVEYPTLTFDDLALTHELIQFAIEQLGHTIQVGSAIGWGKERPIIAEIERYRSQAVELLERLGEK